MYRLGEKGVNALKIDPEYNEAMGLQELDSSDEYTRHIKEADDWLQKALDTAKIKVARQDKQSGGIINDTN